MEILSLIVGIFVGAIIGYARGYFQAKVKYLNEDFHQNFFPLTEDEARRILHEQPNKILFSYENEHSPFIFFIDKEGNKVDITDYKKYA
jgi:hypothetical protein